MSGQQRHEAPDVGDAVVRMLRALVTRAQEGDWEALEQLARIEQLAPAATALGVRLAHREAGYSFTQLGDVLGTSRQAARQRAMNTLTTPEAWALTDEPDAHQLLPGHQRRGCELCKAASA